MLTNPLTLAQAIDAATAQFVLQNGHAPSPDLILWACGCALITIETWRDAEGSWSYRFLRYDQSHEDHDFSNSERALEDARSLMRSVSV